jgi:hypothetical protein
MILPWSSERSTCVLCSMDRALTLSPIRSVAFGGVFRYGPDFGSCWFNADQLLQVHNGEDIICAFACFNPDAVPGVRVSLKSSPANEFSTPLSRNKASLDLLLAWPLWARPPLPKSSLPTTSFPVCPIVCRVKFLY